MFYCSVQNRREYNQRRAKKGMTKNQSRIISTLMEIKSADRILFQRTNQQNLNIGFS